MKEQLSIVELSALAQNIKTTLIEKSETEKATSQQYFYGYVTALANYKIINNCMLSYYTELIKTSITKSSIDQKMYNQGYKYRLIPTNANFPDLYAKTMKDVKIWLTTYPTTTFYIVN